MSTHLSGTFLLYITVEEGEICMILQLYLSNYFSIFTLINISIFTLIYLCAFTYVYHIEIPTGLHLLRTIPEPSFKKKFPDRSYKKFVAAAILR